MIDRTALDAWLDTIELVQSSAVDADVLRQSPAGEPEGSEEGRPALYRTGYAGRPSMKHLIEQEFEKRLESGQVLPTLKEEAKALHEWAKEAHRGAPAPTEGTIMNHIRQQYLRRRPRN